jgi:hypothetical protein
MSDSQSRPIQTSYFFRSDLVKTNNAKHANSAVLRCVDHMQLNHYGATSAEVFDNQTGELHAVVARSMDSKITILFKREVKEGM